MHGKLSMPTSHRAVSESFFDVIDKIMLVTGFLLLVAAVALFSKAYQWVSAASFVLGVLLVVVGAILRSESFRLKVPSKEGWGAILICVSAAVMAGAVIALFFAVPGQSFIMPTSFRRGADSIIMINLDRPNAWLSPILAAFGLGLLVFGVVLKFHRDIF